MNKSLSSDEILKFIDYKANLLTYLQLTKYDSIDKAMGKHKALILLYETSKNYGHWCCVFKRNNNTIEHFDSYGIMPDEELKFVPEYFRKINNELYPHLSALLYLSKCNILYNQFKLQKHSKNINTCGRFVALRIFLRNISLEDFAKLLKSYDKYSPDVIVTLLTKYI